jgi:DNA modification methylase
MVVAPGSWHPDVWDDVNRMRTLNGEQARKELEMHICPLQFDIVERIIERFSNKGDLVLDPFGGLMTVPYMAVKMGRRGYGIELNEDSYWDGIGYLKMAEDEIRHPTLFDLAEGKAI